MLKQPICVTRFTSITNAVAYLAVAGASADVVHVGTVSQESAAFEGTMDRSASTAKIEVPPPIGDFVFDFGGAGETTFKVTWQAPAGQYIEIDVPSDFEYNDLQFYFQIHGLISVGNRNIPLDVNASQLGCNPLPELNGNTRMTITGPTGSGMWVVVYYRDLVPGTTHRVTTLTATITSRSTASRWTQATIV